MKLKQLTVSGFRGFAEPQIFDLSADVILITGANGSGKTSFFDAILWALTGSVDRLGKDSDLVSKYSDFGEARVELVLTDPQGDLRITRRHDGVTHLLVEQGNERNSGAAADAFLIDTLWPDAKSSARPSESLARSVTKAVYLQQDQVRSFIDTENEQSRFEIISELIGAGRVAELLRQLETSRRAWTTATNRMREDLQPLRDRHDALTTEVQRLESTRADEFRSSDWQSLVERIVRTFPDIGTEKEVSPSPRVIEGVLREGRRLQRSLEEKLESVDDLSVASEALAEPVQDLSAAKAEVEAVESAVNTAAVALQEAESRAAAARQRQVAEQEERLSYGALAQLALRHLGDVCPVCQQSYDVEATRAHLAQATASAGVSAKPNSSEVESLAQVLQAREEELSVARARLRLRQQEVAERNSLLKRIHATASSLGIDFLGGDDLPTALVDAKSEVVAQLGDLRALRGLAESFSVHFSRAEDFKRLDDLRAQLSRVAEELQRGDSMVDLRDQAGLDAKQLHERTRQISENLVASELKAIEPLLQRIYSSVDPHPSLRVVNLLTDMKRGRGQFWTSLSDTARDVSVRDPQYVLSSSQLNVLAVVTFIALNLSIETLPLSVVALDDPLQSLDNVNLLGLADLLRRLRDTRQVIVSTHDERLAGLLQRKLRPVEEGSRTSVISIAAWTPRGPSVSFKTLEPETRSLRLLNAAV